MTVADPDFDLFRGYLERACGIVLGDNKKYLVSSRLGRLLDEKGIQTLGELVRLMQQHPRSGLSETVVDAMTTNETLWFRDGYPFEVLKNRLIPEFVRDQPGQRLRIWSTACSSGQEPYSLSMAIDEFERANLGQLRGGAQIIATEISSSMLSTARAARYDGLAMARGLSMERRNRYFDETAHGEWTVKQPLRSRVEFRQLNLLDNYSILGKFDIVFCRNVLIYFSADVKKDILRRIHATLKPGGYLMLGASEALNGLPELYRMVQCNPGIIYQAC